MYKYSRTSLARTRVTQTPRELELNSISPGFDYIFPTIYYYITRIRLIRTPQ